MGMSNGIGTIAGLLCPIAIDYLTSDKVIATQTNVHQRNFAYQHFHQTSLEQCAKELNGSSTILSLWHFQLPS